ncbi:MAG: hypothetical protein JWQ72_3356 [Polaromonas sp.]|nr:hypothetical protein [Polaromonas sp.]
MPTLIQRLFHRSSRNEPARARAASQDNPLTIEDGSENATRRQLVQVLLRDTLRKSGVPPAWIECQMLPVSSRSRGHGMYVRLVITHWDPRFMDYAYAFQKALLADIERFEPNSSSWLHGISWQLELGDSCPYQKLPEKSYWQPVTAAVTPVAASAPTRLARVAPAMAAAAVAMSAQAFQSTGGEDSDPATDLERLFAIRDQELEREIAQPFAPTQSSDL